MMGPATMGAGLVIGIAALVFIGYESNGAADFFKNTFFIFGVFGGTMALMSFVIIKFGAIGFSILPIVILVAFAKMMKG